MVMTPSVVSGSAVDCVMVGLGFGNAHPPVGNALMTHLSQFVSSSCMVMSFHFTTLVVATWQNCSAPWFFLHDWFTNFNIFHDLRFVVSE